MAPTPKSRVVRPINLDLPESALVGQVNKRLSKHRMELVSTQEAVFGDEVNYGKWFVRARRKPSLLTPNPVAYLVQRRVTPAAVASNLNAGILPR